MKSLQLAMIPDDENGAVLRRMLEDGDDLTVPREVDFFLVFGEQAAADAFVPAANALGDVLVSVPEADDEGIWQVTVSRHMAPKHAAITALEKELTVLAEPFGGYPDGWGCMQAVGDDVDADAGSEVDPDAE